MKDTLTQEIITRYFPGVEISGDVQRQIDAMQESVDLIYQGRLAQLYMYGADIVSDPDPDAVDGFGGLSDVARLFLQNGVHLTDGTVIEYDPDNASIIEVHDKLCIEMHELFYPRTLFMQVESENFERQKAFLLRFLEENKSPVPSDKFISRLVRERYFENILPLYLPAATSVGRQQQLDDYIFAVIRRKAFDGLMPISDGLYDQMARGLSESQGTTTSLPAPANPR